MVSGGGNIQEGRLPVHEIEALVPVADTLGCGVAPGVFGATVRRIWKVREAARAAMRRRTLSGRALGHLVGHECFIALGSRVALSVLDASCKFCRATCLLPSST